MSSMDTDRAEQIQRIELAANYGIYMFCHNDVKSKSQVMRLGILEQQNIIKRACDKPGDG